MAFAAWWIIAWNARSENPEILTMLSGEIVYAHRDDHVLNIYSIAANGSNKKMLFHHDDSTNANAMFPRWSDDGTHIYFTAMKDGVFSTFVMNADGTDVQLSNVRNEIVSRPVREVDIIGEQGSLYMIQNDTRVQIYAFSGYDAALRPGASEASWSPDKKYIVFQSCNLTECTIMIANTMGETAVLADGMQPDWRP